MGINNIITVWCFDKEIGKIGYEEDKRRSTFQFNPAFLDSGLYTLLFPFIIKRTKTTQVFNSFNNEHFRGLPPMIADSLPDVFGNLIFKAWLEVSNKQFEKISILEQLTYVANRGMGALEFRPVKKLPNNTTINIEEIIRILKRVLKNKQETGGEQLSSSALLNVFKIGTSAGGARPKILISQHKVNGNIIPGDLEYSDDYRHLLVKLSLNDDEKGYSSELIEYSYYLVATSLNINMTASELIEDKHFATTRFDRKNGKKIHILTASGMTGWDFTDDPKNSSYENLFKLATALKLPHGQIEQLYRRMVFNVVFANADDHLKNHSFMYDQDNNSWDLAPAYDLNYSFNPLLHFTKTSRALSINNKRIDINLEDLLTIADQYTIGNPKGIIRSTQNGILVWEQIASKLNLPSKVIRNIKRDFITFID